MHKTQPLPIFQVMAYMASLENLQCAHEVKCCYNVTSVRVYLKYLLSSHLPLLAMLLLLAKLLLVDKQLLVLFQPTHLHNLHLARSLHHLTLLLLLQLLAHAHLCHTSHELLLLLLQLLPPLHILKSAQRHLNVLHLNTIVPFIV